MFFRNLILFRFSPSVARTLSRLNEALGEHPARPPGSAELSTDGFSPPRGCDDDTTALAINGYTLLVAEHQEKVLPASVVNEQVKKRVQKIAAQEGRGVGGRERKKIREDVVGEMLARAFARTSRTAAYVDTKQGWLAIDTASRKAGERVIAGMREALGSFPAVPLAPKEGPRALLTNWLHTHKLPAGLAFGDEVDLRDPSSAQGPKWKGRCDDLESDEVLEHLKNGKQVFQLGLIFNDRISFVLGEDLVIRKLRFADDVLDELGDSAEDAKQETTASLLLMAGELSKLYAAMEHWFGIPRPSDDDE